MEDVVFTSSGDIFTRSGENIGVRTTMSSNFKWTPPNEADSYTHEITGEDAQDWRENGYLDLCDC